MEPEDRRAEAVVVETLWQRATRQLIEAGFTSVQAREVIHIMEYILPQSVLELTKTQAREIVKEHRAEIHSDFATFQAAMVEKFASLESKISDRFITGRRYWITLAVGVGGVILGGIVFPYLRSKLGF